MWGVSASVVLELCIALELCAAQIALLQQSVRCSSCECVALKQCVVLEQCVALELCVALEQCVALELCAAQIVLLQQSVRCSSCECVAPAVRCSICAVPAKINLFALQHLSSVNFECVGGQRSRVNFEFGRAQLCVARKQDTPARARVRSKDCLHLRWSSL